MIFIARDQRDLLIQAELLNLPGIWLQPMGAAIFLFTMMPSICDVGLDSSTSLLHFLFASVRCPHQATSVRHLQLNRFQHYPSRFWQHLWRLVAAPLRSSSSAESSSNPPKPFFLVFRERKSSPTLGPPSGPNNPATSSL